MAETRQHTLNARGQLISLERPVVMGIINLTPDSFYAGSRQSSIGQVSEKAGKMLDDGAAILDIGGASSRPGADVISAEEELDRVLPVVEALRKAFPEAILSIDTWRALVAKEVLRAGAHIINDITSGTLEPDLLRYCGEAQACYIMMHMQGTPGHMPVRPVYDDMVGDILKFFVARLPILREAGIGDIILDPGFGFGKSVEQNFELLRKLGVFRFLELPLLAGISRKSLVWRTLGISPDEALNGTSALHMVALQQGVSILRAHDVREAVEVITLFERIASA